MHSLNHLATQRALAAAADPPVGVRVETVEGATVLDAGITTRGSLQAGILLARLCLSGSARVNIESVAQGPSACSVVTRTDNPIRECLGGQYAGWPLQTDDYFAMASGPMRMIRGRETMLDDLGLCEVATEVVGVLEADKLPTPAAIRRIAAECDVHPANVRLAIAPSTSLAGAVQVASRSVETALHKLHLVGFDVRAVASAIGRAPLPPPARPGDAVSGIGRTNDAILYGGHVTLWVDAEPESVESIIAKIPSESSGDHGRPFAEIFRDYEYDFYKVDPLLFSPAVVVIHNLRDGRTSKAGRFALDVVGRSFAS